MSATEIPHDREMNALGFRDAFNSLQSTIILVEASYLRNMLYQRNKLDRDHKRNMPFEGDICQKKGSERRLLRYMRDRERGNRSDSH